MNKKVYWMHSFLTLYFSYMLFIIGIVSVIPEAHAKHPPVDRSLSGHVEAVAVVVNHYLEEE